MQAKLNNVNVRFSIVCIVENINSNRVWHNFPFHDTNHYTYGNITPGLVSFSGHEIAPNTVANATKIIVLATKIQNLVAKLATRIL